jgi:hypothetical protein
MDPGVMVAIDIPLVGDERRKNWAKIVSNVDQDRSDGWAYEGEFIAVGGIQDVMAPAVLLIYGEKGSRTNPLIEARVYTVNPDATLTLHESASGRAWARTLRDGVADLIQRDSPFVAGSKPWDPALMGYSDDALDEELDRRRRRGQQ